MTHSHFSHYSHEAAFLRIADLRRAAAEHELAVRARDTRTAEDAQHTGGTEHVNTADGEDGSRGGPRSGTGTGAPRPRTFRRRKARSRRIRAA